MYLFCYSNIYFPVYTVHPINPLTFCNSAKLNESRRCFLSPFYAILAGPAQRLINCGSLGVIINEPGCHRGHKPAVRLGPGQGVIGRSRKKDGELNLYREQCTYPAHGKSAAQGPDLNVRFICFIIYLEALIPLR